MGGGSWGTALVKIILEHAEIEVDWWVRSEEHANYINSYGSNPKYLRSVHLDKERLYVSTDALELVKNNNLIILVTPSAFTYELMDQIPNELLEGKHIFSAVKGVVPQTRQILGDYLFSNKSVLAENFGVITGPCHAEEVAQERLSYLTCASINSAICAEMADILSCRYIRVTESADIYGTEITAVLKNVYAIASGVCHSLGYGDNFQAVLVSNSIREIKRFIEAVHPIDRDTDGSAYLGDLLVTAYSQYSRNRTLGAMLGQGYSVKSALMEMQMIAEGYYATESIHILNEQYKVDMPILDFVYDIIYGNLSAKECVEELTSRLN